MTVRSALAACALLLCICEARAASAQAFDPALHTGNGRPALVLSSPGAAVTVWVGVDATQHLFYAAARGATLVLEASPLGVVVDGADLGGGVTDVFATRPSSVDATYAIHGNHRTARNHFNETTFAAYRTGATDTLVTLVARVYDDGVAWRYVIPGDRPRSVSGEASGWRLPSGSIVWGEPAVVTGDSPYVTAPIGGLDASVRGPLTIALPGSSGYAVITEGGLRSYSGMSCHVDARSTLVRSTFPDDRSWSVAGGSTTPWRLVIVSATLDGLVNSDMVANVNDPPYPSLFPQGAETWFIRAGRMVGGSATVPGSAPSLESQLHYVSEASALRAEYVLVDRGWETGFVAGAEDQFARLAGLVVYAREHAGAGVWVPTPFDSLVDDTARRDFFTRVRDAGARGVTVDPSSGPARESAETVRVQEAILRDAAEFRLMVNLRAGKPTGLNRSYPNALAEGEPIGGAGGVTSRVDVAPWRDTVAPFVSLLAGAANSPPVTFDPARMGGTTFSHQLATGGAMTSLVGHFAQDARLLVSQPAIRDVLRMLPAEWDETVVLQWSAIGQIAAIARRNGPRWWVFAVSGDASGAHTVPLQLPFLGEARFDVVVVSDATPTTFRRDQYAARQGADTVPVDILAGGGFVALYTPSVDTTTSVRQGFASLAQADSQEGWERSFATIRDHGDLIAYSLQDGVPWPEALRSSDPSTYPVSLRARWSTLRSATDAVVPGHTRYLMVNAIDVATYADLAPYWGVVPSMPLPAPWDTYGFDNPDVKAAYLNYLVAAIDFFQPAYLAVSIEANILLAHAPQRWNAFKALNAYIYAQLKSRYPSLQIFSTVHYEHMRGLTTESRQLASDVGETYPAVLTAEVIDLLRDCDLFALSTYPFMVAGSPDITEAGVDADYFDGAYRVAAAAGKQMAIEQTGYLTQDVYLASVQYTLQGSDERQQQFVDLVLRDAHSHGFAFVSNFVSWDYALNYGTSATSLTWAYTGLVREDGTPKPALAIWDRYR